MKKFILAITMMLITTNAYASCPKNITFDEVQNYIGKITQTKTKNVDYWSPTPKYNVQIKTKDCKKWMTVGKFMKRDKLHVVASIESEIRGIHGLGPRKMLLEEKAEGWNKSITNFQNNTVVGKFISAGGWDCSVATAMGDAYSVCIVNGNSVNVSKMK